jgi:hypothetical protein
MTEPHKLALVAAGDAEGAGATRDTAVAPGPLIPRTLAAFAEPGLVLARPGFPIGYLGITWVGPILGGAVRFRRAHGWDPWRPIKLGDPERSHGPRSALVAAAGAIAYQLSPPPDSDHVRTVAINTTDGPGTRSAEPVPAPGWEQITGTPVVGRPIWGADESLRFAEDGSEVFPERHYPTQALTIHHTATPNGDPDPAATLRAIYFFHAMNQKLGDIGYHLLIDEEGTVYQGRRTAWHPDPTADSQAGGSPLTCSGAHVGGYNPGNIGIALVGDFADRSPAPAALRSLVRVLATVASAQRLDPTGRVSYLHPLTGATRDVPSLAAHRDWSLTACPGEAFHRQLESVRTEVAALQVPPRAPQY